jgi:hypothetical protein
MRLNSWIVGYSETITSHLSPAKFLQSEVPNHCGFLKLQMHHPARIFAHLTKPPLRIGYNRENATENRAAVCRNPRFLRTLHCTAQY